MVKIATWNVNSLNVRLPHVLEWLKSAQPDVLALQETKLIDEKFPQEDIEAAGYQVSFSGQKTYNGVAILSRGEIKDVVTEFPDFDDPQRRVLVATVNGIRLLNLYVPNGSEVGSEKYAYKLDWLKRLHDFVQSQQQDYQHILMVGDFNIAPEDRDVHDPAAWQGNVLVSEPERNALSDIMALGFEDTFRLHNQETEFSWWDYRGGGFRRNHGLRIDLLLANNELAKHCTECIIDRDPRAWERPSDHTPVMGSFDI